MIADSASPEASIDAVSVYSIILRSSQSAEKTSFQHVLESLETGCLAVNQFFEDLFSSSSCTGFPYVKSVHVKTGSGTEIK